MTTLFGIKNCDTVKKAQKWLDSNSIPFTFHDFRVDGINEADVNTWLDALGSDAVVNKRSTTWKQLSDEQKAQALEGDAAALICEHPTLIKRPLLIQEKTFHVGFKPDQYAQIFNI